MPNMPGTGDGQAVESEEFTARKIGHDTARTRDEVDRLVEGIVKAQQFFA